jgi:hypothetical protein
MRFHSQRTVVIDPIIACDKREAFAQGSAGDEATQTILEAFWIALLSLAMTMDIARLWSRLSGHAEIALEHGGIGPHLGAGGGVHDRAALQYHDAVGEP